MMETPTGWNGPVFLMNFPLSVSNAEPNNILMIHKEPYNVRLACQQWMKLYNRIAKEALVYVLPGHGSLQDLPFVANLACYLPHMISDVIILSRFTSRPRIQEEKFGRNFFCNFDYVVEQPSYCWEGEADLKWVRNDIYVGGVGQRSTAKAFKWMRNEFNMNIIEVELTDPKLYHLDCVFMMLSENKALVNCSALSKSDIAKIEKVVEVVSVPDQFKYEGWTNGVMLGGVLLHSCVSTADDYADFMAKLNIPVECFCLDEFEKSGADLSCCVLHLNHKNRP
jgi:N-dimethylarginine dimethylaminohydrolase